MKKVLFIAPKFMDIYIDVLNELEKFYSVDFIPEVSFLEDPNNIRCYKGIKKLLYVRPEKFATFNKQRWQTILASESYNKSYDILFVLDGQSIDECVFKILKQRNPNIYCANYLFDTTTGVYRFDLNFEHFDSVYTFDIAESEKYKINHLPIYWKKEANQSSSDIILFGFGRYSDNRFSLFQKLKVFAENNHFKYYLKLATDRKNMFVVKLKWLIRLLTKTTREHIPPSFYESDMNTYDSISPADFRKYIANSEVVIDTNAPHQDGLTARFMWAIGAGKKIITTNRSVNKYSFFSEDRILVVDPFNPVSDSILVDFISHPVSDNTAFEIEIQKYEIGNWLKIILGLSHCN